MCHDAGRTRWTQSRYRHRFTDLTDALIPVYDWGFRVLGGRKHEAFRRHIVELAALRGNERLLDAGCGTGLMVRHIALQHPACRLHGIDLSPNVIAVAHKSTAQRGLEPDLRVGSITDLPYPDGAFDVVITNIMYHHLDMVEKRQAVAEIARVLRPGGRYVAAEFGPRASNPVERHLAKGEYTLYPSHLAEAGLTVQHEELSPFIWGTQVYYRVAVKPDEAAPESQG
jgi:ubiquinone/menaquinone biosynthesis C-methylase UbiE